MERSIDERKGTILPLRYQPAKVIKGSGEAIVGNVKGLLVQLGDPAYNDAMEVFIPEKFVINVEDDAITVDQNYFLELSRKLLKVANKEEKTTMPPTFHYGPCLRKDKTCTFFPRLEDCECAFDGKNKNGKVWIKM